MYTDSKTYNEEVKNFYSNYYDQIYEIQNRLLTTIYELVCMNKQGMDQKPVEHIITRIKRKQSVEKKLIANGVPPTEENAVRTLSDVIGIRLVVHFISDIYKVRNILADSGRFTIVKEKDYVKHAKPTGYRGYHIIVETELAGAPMKAEIQIRTIAMDCWASLEHEIRYKKNIGDISPINDELLLCSKNLMESDIAMEQIWSKTKILRKEGLE